MGEDSLPVTTKAEARAVIEELARGKGSYTDAFKQEAIAEAEKGRKGMLQAIEGGKEVRKDLAMALKMYEPRRSPPLQRSLCNIDNIL